MGDQTKRRVKKVLSITGRKAWGWCFIALLLPELWEACPCWQTEGTTRRSRGAPLLFLSTASHLSPSSLSSRTSSPLCQFVAIAAHSSYNVFAECPFPDGFNVAVLLYSLSLIPFFLNFYHQTYLRGNRRSWLKGRDRGLKLTEPSPERVWWKMA